MNKLLLVLPGNPKSDWHPLKILQRKDILEYDDDTCLERDTSKIYGQGGSRQLSYHAHIQTLDTRQNHAIDVLIDSGCTK